MTSTSFDAAAVAPTAEAVEYAGFWLRLGAAAIDLFGLLFLAVPMVVWYFGDAWTATEGVTAFVVNWVLPGIVAVTFWSLRGATPGKMAVRAMIVDAQTFGEPTLAQLVRRYAAYFASLPLVGIGFIEIAFDARKQGWHDKIAGTVVIKGRRQ